jgi:hypothetical protein
MFFFYIRVGQLFLLRQDQAISLRLQAAVPHEKNSGCQKLLVIHYSFWLTLIYGLSKYIEISLLIINTGMISSTLIDGLMNYTCCTL